MTKFVSLFVSESEFQFHRSKCVCVCVCSSSNVGVIRNIIRLSEGKAGRRKRETGNDLAPEGCNTKGNEDQVRGMVGIGVREIPRRNRDAGAWT